MSTPLLQIASAFCLTLMLIAGLSRLAPRLGLVDTPDHRKQHAGDIPLVGGVAIMTTLIACAFFWQDSASQIIGATSHTVWVFLLAASIITVLGVIDDLRRVSVFTRCVVEVIVALIVIEGLDLVPRNLGDLIGTGNIRLGDWAAYPFTVIAIFGIINAYNMLDGIDGLLSIMVLITIVGFHLFTGLEPGLVSLTLLASLAAFLVSNLRLSPYIPKTFLGDAGSKLLGFIVVALILAVTSRQLGGGTRYVEPVTALYLVGLPLFDMVFTTLRRILGRRSPFAADRSHIHHLMQALDLGHRRSLVMIGCGGLSIPFVGLMLDKSGAATPQQFFIFLGLFAMYCLLMSQAWRVADSYQALKEENATTVSYRLEGTLVTPPAIPLTEPNAPKRTTH
jgi:UDP-GlcNAc:undecaprenyl-phosphate GlcNAc-1-phosphate transferase